MQLDHEVQDALTGKPLPAGTRLIGVELGGGWDYTAECVTEDDFRHFREACLSDEEDLDHEDYYILEEFGRRFRYAGGLISHYLPGLADQEEPDHA